MNLLLCYKALADETRLRLLYLLKHYELNVNELVVFMDMGQSRISRHLKIMTDCGLLSVRRDGLWSFYRAVEKGEGGDFYFSHDALSGPGQYSQVRTGRAQKDDG